jgi:hypothetical protein
MPFSYWNFETQALKVIVSNHGIHITQADDSKSHLSHSGRTGKQREIQIAGEGKVSII